MYTQTMKCIYPLSERGSVCILSNCSTEYQLGRLPQPLLLNLTETSPQPPRFLAGTLGERQRLSLFLPAAVTPPYEMGRIRHFIIFMKTTFFTVRTVKQWNRLHREVVQLLSLEVFKTRLDKAPSNLTWPQSIPCFSSRLGEVSPEVLSNLHHPTIIA